MTATVITDQCGLKPTLKSLRCVSIWWSCPCVPTSGPLDDWRLCCSWSLSAEIVCKQTDWMIQHVFCFVFMSVHWWVLFSLSFDFVAHLTVPNESVIHYKQMPQVVAYSSRICVSAFSCDKCGGLQLGSCSTNIKVHIQFLGRHLEN